VSLGRAPGGGGLAVGETFTPASRPSDWHMLTPCRPNPPQRHRPTSSHTDAEWWNGGFHTHRHRLCCTTASGVSHTSLWPAFPARRGSVSVASRVGDYQRSLASAATRSPCLTGRRFWSSLMSLDLTSGLEKGKLDWDSDRCLDGARRHIRRSTGPCPTQENLYRISLGKNVVWTHH
jgi:hypothetical protein